MSTSRGNRPMGGGARLRGRSLRRSEAARLLGNVPLTLGVLGVFTIIFLALFGAELAPGDPHAQRSVIFYPDGTFASPPTPPDRYNLLGTDPIGRDQLSRLLWGARLTLTIAVVVLTARALLAIALGSIAGWRRGTWVDHLIGYVLQAIGGLPQLMLALLLVILLGGQGVGGFVLALSLVGWPELARFVRAEVVRAATTEHVVAARAIGASARDLLRRHIFRDLAPQLLGLLALEAGAVLLLLAELGFLGFFLEGGVFFRGDSGAPILPARDRAPEWGQMLAGARQYTFSHQYVALVPGVVVVSSVLVFNLLAEGLRRATDPFSPSRLSPTTLGVIGRTLGAALLASAAVLGYLSIRSTTLTFEQGMQSARDVALASLPNSELVAGVVRFSSGDHGLSRPQKLTYYFRDPAGRILRVSYISANANAIDVKLHTNEDGLALDDLPRLVETPLNWERALRVAEDQAGRAFRERVGSYSVRVILVHSKELNRPIYVVEYGRDRGNPEVRIPVDPATGERLAPKSDR